MKKTILIVEDSADVGAMYAQFLALEGFHVVIAHDGQEGVEKAAELLPTLILMDLSLPVLNGLEAAKQIRHDPKTRHIPVILVTGEVRRGPSAVIEAECDGFLVKPCTPKAMLSEIQRVLRRNLPPSHGAASAQL
jgi:two-component system cell cycle response regulator DivK